MLNGIEDISLEAIRRKKYISWLSVKWKSLKSYSSRPFASELSHCWDAHMPRQSASVNASWLLPARIPASAPEQQWTMVWVLLPLTGRPRWSSLLLAVVWPGPAVALSAVVWEVDQQMKGLSPFLWVSSTWKYIYMGKKKTYNVNEAQITHLP